MPGPGLVLIPKVPGVPAGAGCTASGSSHQAGSSADLSSQQPSQAHEHSLSSLPHPQPAPACPGLPPHTVPAAHSQPYYGCRGLYGPRRSWQLGNGSGAV